MLTAALARSADTRHAGGTSLLAGVLAAAPPLAGLLWMSGKVLLPAAVGAMALFALVVLSAGRLALRAAGAADMPAPAAWGLGIVASAIGVYLLVMAFDLRAASAFALWSALIVGLRVAYRERGAGAARLDRAGLLALLLCAAATALWCRDLAQVPQILSRDGLMATWTDQFYHGAVISQFGDPRAAGRQAILLAGTPLPFYHYASYMLPAAFAWPLDLSGLALATAVWVPLGFLTLCAGAYVLGNTLHGPAAGLTALAAVALLPDAGSYGLHNGFFGFHWYVLAVPGASYAVGVCLLAFALLHRFAATRAWPPLAASAALVLACSVVRMHVFLLALPAWLATAALLTQPVRRRPFVFLAAGGGAFVLFVLGFYSWYPGARLALPEFLDIAHRQQVMLPYASLYGALLAEHGAGIAVPAGVLLVFPAFLGIFAVLYPVSVILASRSRGLQPVDFVPVALLAGYLLLMITAPVPANGDATELTQRPFVLVYAAVAVWTVAGFASWLAPQGRLRFSRLRLPLLALAALLATAAVRYTDKDWRWTQRHDVTPGLPQAASFLRSQGRPGDTLAVEGLKAGWVTTDDAVELVALSGMPAYLTRPYIHVRAGGRRKEVAQQRLAALAAVAQAQSVAAARAKLQDMGVQWYVVTGNAGPYWDRERRQAAFTAGSVSLYASR